MDGPTGATERPGLAPVVPLDDAAATDLSTTGGKGANLARMAATDLPTAPGFCVTTAVYDAVVDDAEIRDRIESLADLDPADADAIAEASAAVRDAIRDQDFPTDAREAIRVALDEFDADAYAVRSSATAEDLPTASFAGQHETFLGVPADAVVDRVRDCLASLFTDRAVAYRLRNDVPHADVAMAVVVQPMVEADAAGVLFTADPVSGNRHVAAVDANFGLGDTVVAGDVSPDHARVDRRTGEVLDYEVGEKERVLRSTAGGTEMASPDADRRRARVLPDDQLRTLVDLGARVEELLDAPQDVEWALVDGEFVLLQSRPITSLYPLPSPRPDDDRLHVYLSFGHVQAMPEALPPLVVDFWTGFVNRGLDALTPGDGERPRVTEAGNRLYVDLTPLFGVGPLRQRLPTIFAALSDPAARGMADLLDRRADEFPSRGPLRDAVDVARLLRALAPTLAAVLPRAVARLARVFLLGPPDPDWERARAEAWGHGLADRVRDPDAPADRVRAAFEDVDVSDLVTGLLPHFLPLLLSAALAGRALRRWFPDADDELDALGKGFDAELVTGMNQRLGDLADVARDHPEVRAALRRGDAVEEMTDLQGGEAFRSAFDEFLREFGHRGTGEIDLSRPRWRDDPGTLLGTVRSNLAAGESGGHRDHLRELKADAKRAAERLLSDAARGPFARPRVLLVRRLIDVYRGGLRLREYPKQGAAHLFAAVHGTVSEAGTVLAASGRLDDPDDVWYLRRDELLAALEGDAPVDADVEARRRTHERLARANAPPVLTSEGETPTAGDTGDDDADVLSGTPVSAGVVEGRARVVEDPAVESLEQGEILVAPSTDPGWTPLFLNAAGLVMEVGGRMTHGALVAREYGLPAVASVPGATGRIRTGDRIRVDGERGTVEVLERPGRVNQSGDRGG